MDPTPTQVETNEAVGVELEHCRESGLLVNLGLEIGIQEMREEESLVGMELSESFSN